MTLKGYSTPLTAFDRGKWQLLSSLCLVWGTSWYPFRTQVCTMIKPGVFPQGDTSHSKLLHRKPSTSKKCTLCLHITKVRTTGGSPLCQRLTLTRCRQHVVTEYSAGSLGPSCLATPLTMVALKSYMQQQDREDKQLYLSLSTV